MAAKPLNYSKNRSAKTRVTGKSHIVVRGSKRTKDPDAKRVGPVDPKQTFDVTIELNGPKLPGPNEHIDATLTPADLLKNYGASQKDADAVAKSSGNSG